MTQVSVCLALLVTVLPFRTVWAAPAGVSISPPFQDLIIEDGQAEISVPISLTNHTGQSLTFELSAVDFGDLQQSGGVLFAGSPVELSDRYGLAQWVVLEQTAVSVEPQSTVPLAISIHNDQSLAPGGHYAAIMATVKSAGTSDKPVAIHQTLTTLLFVNKAGGEQPRLALKAAEPKLQWWGGVEGVEVAFANAGNVHLVPRGITELSDPFGRRVAKGIINPESYKIMPENDRNFSSQIQQQAPAIWPGMYTLSTHYRFDGSDTYETQQRTVFHLGLAVPILILLAAIAMVAIVIIQRKRRSEL